MVKKGRREQEHSVDVLFILALFCVFAGSAVLVMTFGANVYQRTVSQMEENYNTRVSLSYVANQVRQHDEKGCITLETLEGSPALVLGSSRSDIGIGRVAALLRRVALFPCGGVPYREKPEDDGTAAPRQNANGLF